MASADCFIYCLGSIEKLINNLLAFNSHFGIKRELFVFDTLAFVYRHE